MRILKLLKKRIARVWGGDSWEQLKPYYMKALLIAWPAAFEGLLISVISSVDTMMVGTISPAAIAAVGLTAQPRMILLILVQSLNIGTTAIIAKRKGAGDEAGVRSALEQSMYISFATGLLVTLAGFFLAESFVALAGANEDTLEMSVLYFQVISLGFIPNSIQLCVCAAYRGLGKTRITMVTHLLSNVVNLLFNYLLIGGRWGFPRLGVQGAAIATFIGTFAAYMVSIWFAARNGSPFHYRLRRPSFDRNTLSGLFRVGSSSVAESGFLRIGFLLTTRIIASLGTVAFAAFHIVSQVSSLSFTLGDGISAAGVAMVGQSLGAGQEDRARRYIDVTRNISILASFLLMTLMFIFRRGLAELFTPDEAVIAAASAGFLVVIPALLPQNGRVVYAGCLRGAGDVRYVAFSSFVGVGVLRPLLTWLFCFLLSPSLPGLQLAATGPWFAFLIDALVRNKLLSDRVKSGKWAKIRLQ